VARQTLSPRLSRLLSSALAVVAALLLVEGLLRARSPAAQRYEVWWPHLHQVFYPDPRILPGISGEKHFVVNSYGLRGSEPPDEALFRFLAVGGSATECLYLDQAESWPEGAAARLSAASGGARVWAGNAGTSGLNARDHVVELKRLLPQLPELELDAVLFLVGVNDLCVRLGEDAGYDPHALERPGAEDAIVRRVFQRVPRAEEQRLPFWKQSSIYASLARFHDRCFSELAIQDDVGANLIEWRNHRAHASAFRDELPDLTEALAEYRRNLDTLIDLSAQAGARPILVTQPALWRDGLTPEEDERLWFGGVGPFMTEDGCAYYTPRALAEGLARFNRVAADVAATRGVELIDAAARFPQDLEHFYDDVHFNERGSAALSDAIAQALLQRPPFSQRLASLPDLPRR
jgi:lysophospholipase L1-like esterase